MNSNWDVDSWKNFQILQQPRYEDPEELSEVLKKLTNLPALVFAGETRLLKNDLTELNQNDNFILQIGDCSESFLNCTGPKIHNFLRLFLQMSKIIEHQSNVKVIKIGRIAGQYAKPRSSDTEQVDGFDIPVYRGDNVNDYEPKLESRIPNPQKLLDGYFYATASLNLIRAFITGGYSEIENISDWEKHFYFSDISNLEYYKTFKDKLNSTFNNFKTNDIIYTSHEALILNLEQAFTRIDTLSRKYYNTSAHTIWIGERTRKLSSAHVEYVRGIENPIGIKIGPDFDENELIAIINKINPKNIDGKIMLITRLGYKKAEKELNRLQNIITKYSLNVIWICDPMHGNSFNHNNYKVRSFDHILSEIETFFKILYNNKLKPGGLHLEVTSDFVSECIGGIGGLTLDNVGDNYTTKVDPRLNTAQALEIAFKINEIILKYGKL